MAKDAKGHGSDGRGGGRTNNYLDPHDPRGPNAAGAVPDKAPVAGAEKVATGRITPEQASATKHSPDAVLGKHDTNYHNKSGSGFTVDAKGVGHYRDTAADKAGARYANKLARSKSARWAAK